MSTAKNNTTGSQIAKQYKLGFTPPSPNSNDTSNEDEMTVDALITKAVNLKLLKAGEDCFTALPTQLVRFAAEASDGNMATRRVNWDKLRAKQLEPWRREMTKEMTATTAELKNTVEDLGKVVRQAKTAGTGLEEGEIPRGTHPSSYAQAAKNRAGNRPYHGRRPEAAIAASAIAEHRGRLHLHHSAPPHPGTTAARPDQRFPILCDGGQKHIGQEQQP
ncbi:hypothetical protein F5890DRAFT_1478309 [Lentinula detonsa]|uniref:Uncharacterized protein n=1 Tax=Lentinula detonsa TaxID=2804962 RepID=A0AA38UMC2_9AGAR|nr:hypothetical protein F5890DRAFT_1478309 [Lentinula detonsa]